MGDILAAEKQIEEANDAFIQKLLDAEFSDRAKMLVREVCQGIEPKVKEELEKEKGRYREFQQEYTSGITFEGMQESFDKKLDESTNKDKEGRFMLHSMYLAAKTILLGYEERLNEEDQDESLQKFYKKLPSVTPDMVLSEEYFLMCNDLLYRCRFISEVEDKETNTKTFKCTMSLTERVDRIREGKSVPQVKMPKVLNKMEVLPSVSKEFVQKATVSITALTRYYNRFKKLAELFTDNGLQNVSAANVQARLWDGDVQEKMMSNEIFKKSVDENVAEIGLATIRLICHHSVFTIPKAVAIQSLWLKDEGRNKDHPKYIEVLENSLKQSPRYLADIFGSIAKGAKEEVVNLVTPHIMHFLIFRLSLLIVYNLQEKNSKLFESFENQIDVILTFGALTPELLETVHQMKEGRGGVLRPFVEILDDEKKVESLCRFRLDSLLELTSEERENCDPIFRKLDELLRADHKELFDHKEDILKAQEELAVMQKQLEQMKKNEPVAKMSDVADGGVSTLREDSQGVPVSQDQGVQGENTKDQQPKCTASPWSTPRERLPVTSPYVVRGNSNGCVYSYGGKKMNWTERMSGSDSCKSGDLEPGKN